MSEEQDVFSIDQLLAPTTNGTHYEKVPSYGGVTRIGSLSSGDMIEWLEETDPVKKKWAGLVLLAKSVVDKDGNRIPEEKRVDAIKLFQNKDAKENGKVIAAILKLNGLRAAAKTMEALKNESGEAETDASPTNSPSQPVE